MTGHSQEKSLEQSQMNGQTWGGAKLVVVEYRQFFV